MYKVLAAIDICNKVIQARDAILDVEVSNIETPWRFDEVMKQLGKYLEQSQRGGVKS